MAQVNLVSAADIRPRVDSVLSRIGRELGALIPGVEVLHIGATAIPGSLTKGDVDVFIRLPRPDFNPVVEILKNHFEVKQPANWTPDFASFGDDTGYDLPLGIQVAVKDSEADFLLFLRDHLISNPAALAEYNRLKTEHAPRGAEEYWKAKDAFLSGILSARKKA